MSNRRDDSKAHDEQDALPQQIDHHRVPAVVERLHTGGKDHGYRAEGQ